VTPVRAERGLLQVGARRIPLLAGELHFWRLDPANWEPTLRAVAAERIPIVSTYLPWRRYAPEPEAPFAWRHDERLDVRRFLALCAAHGLLVQLKPGPWICAEETNGGYPEWLLADAELLALDAQDRPVAGYNPPFRHPVPCYLHPRYLEHARRWIGLVNEHVRDFLHPRGPVALIQLDNEPSYCFRDGMYEADYHPVALEAFARWTLERHGSLDAVNAAWRSELWAESEIEPPREPESGVEPGTGRWRWEHDWIGFREWLLAEHLRLLRSAHREAGAQTTAFTVNYNTHPVDGVPQSPRTIHSVTGAIAGMDHYYEPPLDTDDLLAVARCAALVAAAGPGLSWSPEIQAGIWRSPGERVGYADPSAAEQELYYLAALAFGLKGLNFYMLVNRENWEFAPLEPGGLPTPMLRAVRAIVRLIDRVPEFGELELAAPVALAWHPTYARDAYAARAGNSTRTGPHEATLGAFAALARAGYLPRIWNTDQGLPADVAAIVTSTAAYMPRGAQEDLAELDARGVPVIVLGDPPRSDVSGHSCDVLARAVSAAEAATAIDNVPALLRAHGIEAPVRVDEQGGFATLQNAPGRQLVFALNARPERLALSLHFASSSITALRSLTDDGLKVPVTDRTARVELGPNAGQLFEAAVR
jgi:hypothetical protein